MNPDLSGQPAPNPQPVGQPVPDLQPSPISAVPVPQIDPVGQPPMMATPPVSPILQPVVLPIPQPDLSTAFQPSASQAVAPTPPQPLFTPMTDASNPAMPAPGMAMPGSAMPQAQGMSQPAFTPLVGSSMPKTGGKKKLIIFGVIGLVIISGIVGAFFVLQQSALITSLSSDSIQGLNYKRPSNWIKDNVGTDGVTYHPKITTGKSSGASEYALYMAVTEDTGTLGAVPNTISTAEKNSINTTLDEKISSASSDLLPLKSAVSCLDDPVFKDKPKRITIDKAFFAISYSFTCADDSSTTGSKSTLYFVAVDIVPNDKDAEYIGYVRAASTIIYDANKAKINEIMSSFSL